MQVSHLSTCACLSDKSLFPTFFRTVPSDRFQVIGLVQLMKYLDWRWVGIIYSKGLYSKKATADFAMQAQRENICVEYRLPFSKKSATELKAIVTMLRESTSKVVLLFLPLSSTKSFLSKMESYNITGKQWLGSEAWITQVELASPERMHILQGTIGFAIPRASILGLGEYLLSLKPSDEPHSAIVKAVWEKFFDCSFLPSNTSVACTGTEDLRTVSNDYTDVTHFRAENNVYKAVYLVAHAMHILLQCKDGSNPTTRKPCVTKEDVRPRLVSSSIFVEYHLLVCGCLLAYLLFAGHILKHLADLSPQVLEHIKYVNFTTREGAKVYFDESGETVAQYDLVNWQMQEDGSVEIAKIGRYDASFPEENKLRLDESAKIIWGGNNKEVHENCI